MESFADIAGRVAAGCRARLATGAGIRLVRMRAAGATFYHPLFELPDRTAGWELAQAQQLSTHSSTVAGFEPRLQWRSG